MAETILFSVILLVSMGPIMILCFICGLPFGGLTAAYLCMFEVMGGILVMIAYHNKLNRMYHKKGDGM